MEKEKRREEKRRWSRVAHRPTSFIQSFANQDKPLILPFRLPSKISHCFASNIPKSLSHPLPSPLPPPRLPLPTIRVSLTGFLPSHHPSWPPVSRSQGPSTAMAVLLEEILKSVELWLKLINKPEPFVDPNLDPVLLVPGVGGSILNAVNGDTGKEERVWVRIFGADSKLQTELWSFYDPASGESVCFDPKIKIRVPDERNGLYSIDTLDPDMIIGCDSIYYYHDMIVEMTKWGFQEGKTLFGFGYDFRQSNRLPETLDLLAAKLEAVYNASGGKKINLISHSMGGLLVKCFMGLRSKVKIIILHIIVYNHLS